MRWGYAILTWIVLVAGLAAQAPMAPSPFREVTPQPVPALPPPETIPALPQPIEIPPRPASPIVDPEVKPAQELQPPVGGPPRTVPDSPTRTGPPVKSGIAATPEPAAVAVAHPPTPGVRIQVLVPAHVAPGKPIPYKIIVSNPSQASAHRVLVRMPIPEGAAQLNKVEPAPDGWAAKPEKLPAAAAMLKELTWNFKTLARGESKTIELEFSPAAGSKDVAARAYVAFEHGEQVTTVIEKPKLAVKKNSGEEIAQGEPVTVRVEVRNTGLVPIPKVRLVESVSAGFEFRTDTQAEKGEKPNQRVWQLGSLAPGQSKIVTYQLVGKQGGDLSTTSHAASEDASVASETVESKTRVLVPGVQFAFAGPTEPVPAQGVAIYEATVRNSGTLPLTNLRVTIPIPSDCEVRSMTNRGERSANAVSWVIPKLARGEAESFRIKVEAKTSGKRSVRATLRDARGLVEEAKDLTTTFLGRADLHWSFPDEPVIVAVGKPSRISVVVRNDGAETAKAVRLRIAIPKEVRIVGTVPAQPQLAGDEILFKEVTILPGRSTTFTLNYEGKSPGRATFGLRLQDSDSLGDRELQKTQHVEIVSSK